MTKLLLPLLALLALAFTAVPAASPAAEGSTNRAESAIKKGIRDFARVAADGATASRIVVSAEAIPGVGDKSAVTGSFRLTKGGKTVTYRLTSKARVLRLSPSGIEYRVAAQAVKPATGLPKSTGGFTGFFQGPAARES
jgi:hypothetical protein